MKSKDQIKYDYWRKRAMKLAWFAPVGESKKLGVSFVYGQLWVFVSANDHVSYLGVLSLADRLDAIMAASYIRAHSKKTYRDGLAAFHKVADIISRKRLQELQWLPLAKL